MSISCRLLAVGAVSLPSGRLIPDAAQSIFERTFTGNGSELNSREELLFAKSCIKGLPAIWGFESWIGFCSSPQAVLWVIGKMGIKKTRMKPIAAARKIFLLITFIFVCIT